MDYLTTSTSCHRIGVFYVSMYISSLDENRFPISIVSYNKKEFYHDKAF